MALQDTLEQINNLDLSDIDWSRVGVWPFAGKAFLWAVAVVAILIACYVFFVKELNQQLDRETLEEVSLKQSFQEKAFQAAKLPQYQELMLKMETDFEFLVSQLPEKTQVPGLLDDIDEKGRDSGLSIVSIKLQPEVTGDIYVELPIEIIVKGSYHDLGTFISSIAGMSRIVTLHDFTIAQGEDQASQLQMTIDAKTYRYRSLDAGEVDS
ncbi:MAG: type 4a pilus biogenesis protein PilO [Cellvibrionaceae bacterium]|nr:type 4a pilus biogenesis protein PilO [Cellvibrionaceae bacterium]